jgi:hypothetical protein
MKRLFKHCPPYPLRKAMEDYLKYGILLFYTNAMTHYSSEVNPIIFSIILLIRAEFMH